MFKTPVQRSGFKCYGLIVADTIFNNKIPLTPMLQDPVPKYEETWM